MDREASSCSMMFASTPTGRSARRSPAGPTWGRGRLGNVLLTNGRTERLTANAPRNAVERWRILNAANARSLGCASTARAGRWWAPTAVCCPSPHEPNEFTIAPGQRFELEVRMEDPESAAAQARRDGARRGRERGGGQGTSSPRRWASEGEVEPRPAWVAPNARSRHEPGGRARAVVDAQQRGGRRGVEFTVNGRAGVVNHGATARWASLSTASRR